eukprot:365532-Chlamydomonas_euryale.AAC.10
MLVDQGSYCTGQVAEASSRTFPCARAQPASGMAHARIWMWHAHGFGCGTPTDLDVVRARTWMWHAHGFGCGTRGLGCGTHTDLDVVRARTWMWHAHGFGCGTPTAGVGCGESLRCVQPCILVYISSCTGHHAPATLHLAQHCSMSRTLPQPTLIHTHIYIYM